ncbi:RNA polymerase Rpc34, partial [Cerioporus squamosus]
SSRMSRRKLNALEQKLHQAALADPRHVCPRPLSPSAALTQDASEHTAVLNFLLATGLLKAMKDGSPGLTFCGVAKKVLEEGHERRGGVNKEEALILSYIQAAQSEGMSRNTYILYQTVIDSCLQALTQSKAVKTAMHHKYPTRKIYILYHLQLSEEMTGDQWYTDNELNTEFIKLLCSACMHFVCNRV